MTPKQIGKSLQHQASKAPMHPNGRFEATFDNFTVRCNNSQYDIGQMAKKFLKAPAMLESYSARDNRRAITRDFTQREPRLRLAARYPEETFL